MALEWLVIVPQERTLLLNPRHPAAAKLKCSPPERFGFDPRLVIS